MQSNVYIGYIEMFPEISELQKQFISRLIEEVIRHVNEKGYNFFLNSKPERKYWGGFEPYKSGHSTRSGKSIFGINWEKGQLRLIIRRNIGITMNLLNTSEERWENKNKGFILLDDCSILGKSEVIISAVKTVIDYHYK